VISETHEFWKRLVNESSPQLNTEMTCDMHETAHQANTDKWKKIIAEQPSSGAVKDIPKKLDKWHYIAE
ncbi:hypothetical protein WUBG_09504, partial [Wuchereria bancrofti]